MTMMFRVVAAIMMTATMMAKLMPMLVLLLMAGTTRTITMMWMPMPMMLQFS